MFAIYFLQTIFFDLDRHLVDVTFSTNQKSSPLVYTLVVYIDMFCRHLQTLFHIFMNTFHIFVESFIIIKKLLFSVQFFFKNCSSQTHKLLTVYVDIILCLCRQFCRHFCCIETMIYDPTMSPLFVYSQSSSYRLNFLSMQTFCLHFVDNFEDFRRHFCSIEMMIDEPDPQTSLPIMQH